MAFRAPNLSLRSIRRIQRVCDRVGNHDCFSRMGLPPHFKFDDKGYETLSTHHSLNDAFIESLCAIHVLSHYNLMHAQIKPEYLRVKNFRCSTKTPPFHFKLSGLQHCFEIGKPVLQIHSSLFADPELRTTSEKQYKTQYTYYSLAASFFAISHGSPPPQALRQKDIVHLPLLNQFSKEYLLIKLGMI